MQVEVNFLVFFQEAKMSEAQPVFGSMADWPDTRETCESVGYIQNQISSLAAQMVKNSIMLPFGTRGDMFRTLMVAPLCIWCSGYYYEYPTMKTFLYSDL